MIRSRRKPCLPTLYAYVSRGLIRSEPTPGGRSRRYRAEDVRQLKAKREPQGGELDKTAQQALHWGAPVLDSALTLIADGALYYRGVDATALARDASVEQVARLLWGVETADPFTAALLPDRNAAFRSHWRGGAFRHPQARARGYRPCR